MPSAVSIDPRLVPALAELAAHPEWTGGTPFDQFTISGVVPGPEFLCVELSRPTAPRGALAVDVGATPWRVVQTAFLTPALDDMVMLGPDDWTNAAEVCMSTAGGHEDPWPPDAAAIEVNGYEADTPLADALRDALFADPSAFGIDRSGFPALNLYPRYPDAMDPIDGPGVEGCIAMTVYVGGPRAGVHARFVETDGRVTIERVRVVSQALWPVDPTPPDGC
jgi:hypothetical protein